LTCVAAAFKRAPLAWAVPKPYSWEAAPPTTTSEAFVKWMVANRGEELHFLAQRFGRYQTLVVNRHVLDERNKRAFLMTPPIKVTRLDIYGVRIIPFVPFTKLDGDTIKGTHNQP
jgi:hypothetical protein